MGESLRERENHESQKKKNGEEEGAEKEPELSGYDENEKKNS